MLEQKYIPIVFVAHLEFQQFVLNQATQESKFVVFADFRWIFLLANLVGHQ